MRRKKLITIIAALSVAISIASVYAYYTSTARLLNTFIVGNIDIELAEPLYDAENSNLRSAVAPDADITKDPVVTNEGTNDAFIFLEVCIPIETVMTANRSTGAKIPASQQELFTFNINNEWKQVSTDNEGRYVFAYVGDSNKLAALKPGETTTVLFKDNKVHLINIVEGQGIKEKQFNIPVTAYAIQADDITETDSDDPITVWNVLDNQKGGR